MAACSDVCYPTSNVSICTSVHVVYANYRLAIIASPAHASLVLLVCRETGVPKLSILAQQKLTYSMSGRNMGSESGSSRWLLLV